MNLALVRLPVQNQLPSQLSVPRQGWFHALVIALVIERGIRIPFLVSDVRIQAYPYVSPLFFTVLNCVHVWIDRTVLVLAYSMIFQRKVKPNMDPGFATSSVASADQPSRVLIANQIVEGGRSPYQ